MYYFDMHDKIKYAFTMTMLWLWLGQMLKAKSNCIKLN